MLKKILGALLILLCGYQTVEAKCCGKVDIGPAYIELDILQSGKTIETRRVWVVRGDSTILVWGGYFLKPGFMWGDNHTTKFTAGSIGAGHCFPIGDRLVLMPSVGVAFTYLKVEVDLDLGPFVIEDITEKFHSTSPYIAMEFTYKLNDCWTLMGMYQYAWSKTHTTIGDFEEQKSHSCGPNYSLGIDYSINKCWSVTFGVGYNITLSHEKHGLRGKGAKLGLAYYF